MVNKKKKLYPLKFEEGTSILNQDAVISNGFLAENSLDDVIETYLADAVGIEILKYYRGELPVTIEYLKMHGKSLLTTSPDDGTARERYEVLGKSRLWYISRMGKGARIYLGFKEELTPEKFYNRCIEGNIADSLNIVDARHGDCLFIKPGYTIATEGDIEVVEVAQNSPASYTLYDLSGDNMDSDGGYKYILELGEAIDIINYSPANTEDFLYEQAGRDKTIADAGHFIARFLEIEREMRVFPSAAESCIMYACIDGEALIKTNDNAVYSIEKGEFVFIPESMDDFLIVPEAGFAHLLEVTIPQPPQEEDSYLNDSHENRNKGDGHCHGHVHDCCCGDGHAHSHDN